MAEAGRRELQERAAQPVDQIEMDRKQVWRSSERDLIAKAEDSPPADAEALLQPMMRAGQRTEQGRDSLTEIRARASVGRGPRPVEIDPSLLR